MVHGDGHHERSEDHMVHGDSHRETDNWRVGFALLAGVVLMMALNYVTNASDPDFRRHSYEIIHSTIAIFCAVIWFSSLHELLEESHAKETVAVAWFRASVAALWYVVLQVVVAYSSNLFMSTDRYQKWIATSEGKANTKANLGTAVFFLSHVTGFFTISAFGCLQQTDWFRQTPAHAFVAILCVSAFLSVLAFMMFLMRHVVTRWDGQIEQREKEWVENVQEAEADVWSLVLSFLVSQVVRFIGSGKLPDTEGHSSEDDHEVTLALVLRYTPIGLLIVLTPLLLSWGKRQLHLQDEDPQEAPDTFAATLTVHSLGANVLGTGVVHLWEVACTTCTMTVAWTTLFASRRGFAQIHIIREQGACIFSISLALLVSVVCFALVWLVGIKSRIKRNTAFSMSQQLMVKASGLLIGFSWEKCFHAALEAIGEATTVSNAKAFLGLGAVLVVFPAWRLYIAPMVINDGWRFGFVPVHVVLKTRALHASGDHRCTEFVREYRNMLHELQTIHHQKDIPDIDETVMVFNKGLHQAGLAQNASLQKESLRELPTAEVEMSMCL